MRSEPPCRPALVACALLLTPLVLTCAAPESHQAAVGVAGTAEDMPVGNAATRAQAPDGRFISWREHVIDDPAVGGAAISGSDGLWMADLDGDGFLDIASVHESDTEYDGVADGHVRVAFGSDDPDRWELRTVAEGEAAAAPEDVVAADLDGDGDPDLVVACELAHLLYLENPGGAAARTEPWPQLVVPATEGRGSFIRVAVADFDRDGRPEVAAANKGAQNPSDQGRMPEPISWFSIDGDPLDGGSWVEHELIRVDWPINVVTIDLDGDGDLDLFAGSRGEGRVMWFENEGVSPPSLLQHEIEIAGSTIPPERRPQGSGPPDRGLASGFNVDFADLDGDHRLDLVLREGDSLVWLSQPEDVGSKWTLHRIGSMAPDNLVGFTVADLDGDGDADVFAGAYSRGPRDHDGEEMTRDDELGGLAWFQNPGDATGAWTRHDVSRRKRGMFDEFIARDMNGDGDLDLVSTRGNSAPWDGVLWLEQVRTEQPVASFERARAEDSREMPRPAGE